VRFSHFELNPKLEDVQRGIEIYRNFEPDVVIALGGGTAIDLAKLIGTLSVQKGAERSKCSRDIAMGVAAIEVEGKPMIAIPTTAGTGSEATHFAVVYVDGEKYSVAHPSMLPDYAIVDPTLTESLPKRITAATGLDALCQAIESIWAVAATEESMGYAQEAARLAFDHLAAAVNAPTPEARRAMFRASHLAGKAINITKTTAPHALSYFLTSRYGVPHGMAVATTLRAMLEFNADVTDDDCVDPRGATAVRERIARILNVLGTDCVDEACSAISSLLSLVECPTLKEILVNGDLMAVVDSANIERLSNNPRRVSREQLIEVLSSEPFQFET
jgi:alcohol dehydrogenase class IV